MWRQENIHNDKGKVLSNLKENLTKVLKEVSYGCSSVGEHFSSKQGAPVPSTAPAPCKVGFGDAHCHLIIREVEQEEKGFKTIFSYRLSSRPHVSLSQGEKNSRGEKSRFSPRETN